MTENDRDEAMRAKIAERRNTESTHREDVAAIMRSESGRRFFWHLIRGTGFWESCLGGDDRQGLIVMARRSVGVDLWNELRKLVPNEHRLMCEENLTLEDSKK